MITHLHGDSWLLPALLLPTVAGGAMIGQSQKPGTEPIPWTVCAWCVADTNDNVYLPDGFFVRAGRRSAEKMVRTVPGTLHSNGTSLFAWVAERGEMSHVKPVEGGLVADGLAFRSGEWDLRFAFAPEDCKTGFAAKAPFFAYERPTKKVIAFRADGRRIDNLLDVTAFGFKNEVTAIAVHPSSGDLLLQTYWPECQVHRIAPDGREVKDGVWPQKMWGGGFAFVRGELWSFSAGAWRVTDRLGVGTGGLGGEEASGTHGLAWGGNGWWLATNQGALFYSGQNPKRCIRRLGGVGGVTAFAVSNTGEIVASVGNAILAFWLDDGQDDAPHSTGGWMWTLGGRWAPDHVSAMTFRDGLFFLREDRESATWVLDPSVDQWTSRDRRMFRTNEVFSAKAEDVTCGGWTVSYDAERHAFVRTKKDVK